MLSRDRRRSCLVLRGSNQEVVGGLPRSRRPDKDRRICMVVCILEVMLLLLPFKILDGGLERLESMRVGGITQTLLGCCERRRVVCEN